MLPTELCSQITSYILICIFFKKVSPVGPSGMKCSQDHLALSGNLLLVPKRSKDPRNANELMGTRRVCESTEDTCCCKGWLDSLYSELPSPVRGYPHWEVNDSKHRGYSCHRLLDLSSDDKSSCWDREFGFRKPEKPIHNWVWLIRFIIRWRIAMFSFIKGWL